MIARRSFIGSIAAMFGFGSFFKLNKEEVCFSEDAEFTLEVKGIYAMEVQLYSTFHLVKIHFQRKPKISCIITENHIFRVYENGVLVSRCAKDLRRGDKVLVSMGQYNDFYVEGRKRNASHGT
jgi:intein/homing endonuclease